MIESAYSSVNPFDGSLTESFPTMTDEELEQLLEAAQAGFARWRAVGPDHRASVLRNAADLLERDAPALAHTATLEMGKTLASAEAEVHKCAATCRWFAENGETLIRTERMEVDGDAVEIRYLPIGVVFAVMPWNFPYWQVVRFLAPTLMAGNAAILKHAPSTPRCALAIVDLFARAGLPKGVFQNAFLTNTQAANAICDDRVAAVTLTGSERAGIAVGLSAARAIKKCVLELGGSDPFIVMPSADPHVTAKAAIAARFQNNGQSCVCAKRFIVHKDIYDRFCALLMEGTRALKVGDPLSSDTDLGPLSSHAAREQIAAQVERARMAGGNILVGGERLPGPGAFYAPTIIAGLSPSSAIAREEFFGPVGLLFKVSDIAEAIALANDVPFGLGASIWTREAHELERLRGELESGMVYANAIIASDPRLPFGGVKRSGHGRELGRWGMHEFVNVRTLLTSAAAL